jgi:hypothetical protein
MPIFGKIEFGVNNFTNVELFYQILFLCREGKRTSANVQTQGAEFVRPKAGSLAL